VTLLEWLVKNLDKNGGWPNNANKASCKDWAHAGFLIHFFDKNGEILSSRKSMDFLSHGTVTRNEYEAAMAELTDTTASQVDSLAWNGTGLPPVGTICEALMSSGKSKLWSWQLVKVVESGIAGAEKECLVYNLETTYPSWVDEFRPIRTEAERRREKACKAMTGRIDMTNEIASLIYDDIAAGKIPGVKLED